jgi:D-alanine transaminase
MTRLSYVNGSFIEHEKASLHIDDRGTLFSDGVYEVAIAIDGKLIDWNDHCVRLAYSLNGLRINYTVNSEELRNTVIKLLELNGKKNAVLYLQITRGAAPRLHQFPANDIVKPSLVLTVSDLFLPTDDKLENGVKAITVPDLRWKRRDFKTISLLPNILAKQQACDVGVEEAIMFEENGKITEGSSTNFFIIDHQGRLRTHESDYNILGGITRNGVIKVAQENAIEIIEKSFTKDEIFTLASEAFITSTTKHVLPIVNIDNNNIGSGKVGMVTKKLIGLYKDYIQKQVQNDSY